MIPYKALIFDMDGLMVDTERLYWKSEYQIARQEGVALSTDTLHKMMGRKPLEAMQIFCTDLGLKIDPAVLLKQRDNIMLDLMEQDLIPLTGLFNILDTFQNRLTMAIATGSHSRFLNLVVDKLVIRHYFKILLCTDNIKQGKPHPEIYLKACKMLQLEPQQCIVLEDTENGCRSACQAGCFTIAVPSEYTQDQDFSMAQKVVNNLIEANEYINELLRIQ